MQLFIVPVQCNENKEKRMKMNYVEKELYFKRCKGWKAERTRFWKEKKDRMEEKIRENKRENEGKTEIDRGEKEASKILVWKLKFFNLFSISESCLNQCTGNEFYYIY